MQGILRLPDIEYIVVYEDGVLVAQQGEQPKKNFIEHEFTVKYLFRGENIVIGKVRIVASLKNTYNHLYEQALNIIISNMFKTFFISGFMLLLFYNLIARHLFTLGNFAEKIGTTSYENKLELNRKPKKGDVDEIDQLANILIKLQERLKDSIVALNEKQVNLANNEAKFRGVLESAVDGILMIDESGELKLVNNALCNITGYTKDELIGKKIEKLVPGNFRDHKELRENYFKNPVTRNMGTVQTLEACRKDGTKFCVDVSLAPVSTEDGTMVTAMVQDITERMNIESETEDLLKSLKYKNDELERFTYTVSHDLKSPLVTINSFIGLLKKDITAGNEKRIEADFKRISDAANTMQNLLDVLLELSRIGRQSSTQVNVSVNDIVASALEMLSGKIKNKCTT